MPLIDNLIRSATRDGEDLAILVINDNCSDYVERLAASFPNHKFYLNQKYSAIPQWDRPIVYDNIKYYMSPEFFETNYIDGIICFNRSESLQVAQSLSRQLHVPYVNVDMASSLQRYPAPYGSTVNLPPAEELAVQHGAVCVGVEDFITDSWKYENSRLNTTIKIPPKKININPNANKILIDSSLPQEFYQQLPINFNNGMFTDKINEAAVYCHFISSPTTMLIDCMYSEMPIISFDLVDMKKYYHLELCIMINDIKTFETPNFLQKIENMVELIGTTKKAKEYVKNNQEDFKKWNSIFKYLGNFVYQRGM